MPVGQKQLMEGPLDGIEKKLPTIPVPKRAQEPYNPLNSNFCVLESKGNTHALILLQGLGRRNPFDKA